MLREHSNARIDIALSRCNSSTLRRSLLCALDLVLRRKFALQANPPSVVHGSRPVYAHGGGGHHRNVELRRRRWWPQARSHAQIGLGAVPPCNKLRDRNVSCVVFTIITGVCEYNGTGTFFHPVSPRTLSASWPCVPSTNAHGISQVEHGICPD